MKLHPLLLAGAAALALVGCQPLAADYSESEAVNALRLDDATTHLAVRFAPGSAHFFAADAARLRALAASGAIAPSDRVIVAAGGRPALAAARSRAVAAVLLPYGIVVREQSIGGLRPNEAVIVPERYLVTLPPCPNWSKKPPLDFANAFPSNYGCATAVNLGRSIAYPADLVEGRLAGAAEGQPAASAVNRYLNDKVQLPTAATVGPIAAPATPTPAASAGGATAGAAGSSP